MISWERYIQIDRTWVDKQLISQYILTEPKLSARVYTIKFSGTLCSTNALIEELMLMLKHFVLSPKKMKELGPDKTIFQTLKYFGNKDPQTDGKYGEVLLFALVEAVLGCKMIAHKIRTLSNYKDQVKGGDGIFLGNYQINTSEIVPAYLIGESKVMDRRSKSISEGFDSLNRFHDMINSPEFLDTEFMVAKENIYLDDTLDYEEVYDRLTFTTDKFREQVLIHPILLMFNSDKISAIEKKSSTNIEAEKMVESFTKSEKHKVIQYIKTQLEKYPQIQKVYLDFFLMPIKNVDEFRNVFYYSIHNATYK